MNKGFRNEEAAQNRLQILEAENERLSQIVRQPGAIERKKKDVLGTVGEPFP